MVKINSREKAFDIFNVTFMCFLILVMVYPVLLVFGRSFMSDADRALNPFSIFPKRFEFVAYQFLFSDSSYLLNSYMITIFRATVGTLMNIIVTAAFSYVVSKKRYPLRNLLTTMVIITMWFNGGLIPTYLTIRSLGLIDSLWTMVLPSLMSVWNMLLLRNFFMEIPETIEEAATIDGANDIVILIKIIILMSMAAIATISLFYLVWHWNSWFDALVYINSRSKWPVQVFLREVLASASSQDLLESGAAVVEELPPTESLKMASVVVTIIPILMVYPFIQKYFVAGVRVGSLKG